MQTPQTLLLLLAIAAATSAHAQTYSYDGDLATVGIQNGNGNWSTDDTVAANKRWLKDGVYSAWDNSGLAIAELGSTASVNGGILTLAGEIKLAGMNILPLGTPIGTQAYAFNGGTLNFGNGGVINVANAASAGSGGNQWVTFTSALKGSNLTIQKSTGSTIAFVRLSSVNDELTGSLTLKSASGATSGIYLSVGSPTYIRNVAAIDVQSGSVFNPTGGGVFTQPISINGAGASNYGAIRVDASGTTFSGALILTGNARVQTHINTVNTVFSGGISETGGSWSFNRTANVPSNTVLPLTLTLTAPSTYTGTTVLGRALTYTSTTESTGTEGGVTILDFTGAQATTTDMLYNGTAAGAVQLMGGLSTRTELQLLGAAAKANSQRLGGLSVQQSATALTLVSGFGGSMSIDLGSITRSGSGVLAITAPVSGQITGTAGGISQGLLGAWATYRSADGVVGGWAGLSNGKIGLYTGDLAYATTTTVNALPGYTNASNLTVSSASAGAVIFGSGTTNLATLSMTDSVTARSASMSGTTLRFADSGGVQIISGAQSLTLGSLGDGSTVTGGGIVNNTAGQILLTNMSKTSSLTINSTIANNGTGAVSLNLNGIGRIILTAASSFSGTVTVESGTLEVRDSNALGATGTTGITKIMTGASLQLSGGLTLGETIQANGHGVAMDGAIRNLDGINTITPTVRIQSSTRFTSDGGTLLLAGGVVAQISSTAYTFAGPGNHEVHGITATSGILNKEGSGTLTLAGISTASGTTSVTNGTLHLDFTASDSPASNILYNGVTFTSTSGILSLGGGTLKATGKADTASTQVVNGLTLTSGYSRITVLASGTSGTFELSLGAITRPLGTTLRFDLSTGANVKTTSGTDNSLLTATGGVAYATVGLNDWAATGAAAGGVRTIVGLSTLSNAYTASTASALSGNASIAAGVTATTLTTSTAISSLRFDQAQATTITQDTSALTLTVGGILITPNVGANASVLTGGGIRAAVGAADLTIFQNNTAAPLTISSRLLNPSTGSAGLTKTGAGTLIFEYTSGYATGDYTGSTRIQDGALQLVRNTTTAISYGLYSGTTFILGSGSNSGKLVLGSTSTGNVVSQFGGLKTEGSGTGNAVVGGTTGLGTFLHYASGTYDFRSGFIGGAGTNENNLNLQISIGTLQLGTANTYKGKTSLLQNTLEVTKLADRGVASSLGTGDYNSTTHIIDMATATTSSQNYDVVATLRYIGDTNSVTNRPVNVTNADIPTDVISVTAIIENTGTGTVKFTAPFTAGGSNTVQRVLRLGGTNTGANEIVSFANVTSGATSRVEKTGTGTWVLTGASTYSGGTTVSQGTLLVTNATGSGTGSGSVTVGSGAVFGGSGRVVAGADQSISFSGAVLQVGTELPGQISQTAAALTLQTSGTGSLIISGGTTLKLDLFSGAGAGDNTALGSAADIAVIVGNASFAADTVLQISNPNAMAAWAAGDKWKLFDWSGLTTPLTTSSVVYDLPSLTGGLLWDTSSLFTTGVLTIGVPEASRSTLLLLAGICLSLRRRRHASMP